ncbi:MAG: hypothetical protein HY718_06105, partial [Planctomycetes bacterium]|nr:hypothetical protein [Planctomycetota bacterium]
AAVKQLLLDPPPERIDDLITLADRWIGPDIAGGVRLLHSVAPLTEQQRSRLAGILARYEQAAKAR